MRNSLSIPISPRLLIFWVSDQASRTLKLVAASGPAAGQPRRGRAAAKTRQRFGAIVGTAKARDRTDARFWFGAVVRTGETGHGANTWLRLGAIVVAAPFLHAVGDAGFDPTQITPVITCHGRATQTQSDNKRAKKTVAIHDHSSYERS